MINQNIEFLLKNVHISVNLCVLVCECVSCCYKYINVFKLKKIYISQITRTKI